MPQVTSAGPEDASPLSLASVGVVLLRHRYLILRIVVVAAALSVTAGLLARRTWTVMASFTPQSSDRGLSQLAGIAAQFGLAGVAPSAGPSPEFYADVMTSRQLLRQVAETPFEVGGDSATRKAFLADLLEVEGEGAIRRERTIDRLRKSVGVVTSTKTGTVELNVRMPAPDLAQQVAARMLDLLNEFNLQTRQSQARAERIFVQRRLEEVGGELRSAENALQSFLQANRQFQDSPQLAFQRERLQREVSLRQQLYASLSQAYEQSRIDEVRDTPVITVVESPVVPAEPDSRRVLVRGIVGIVLGLMLGVFLAFVREYARRNRQAGDATYEDLVELRREMADDLKRPLRVLRRGR